MAIGLVTAMALGRRWALIVYTVLFVLGALISLPALLTVQHTTASLAWFACDTAMRAVAIVLLFGRPATAWFAAYRPPRPEPAQLAQTARPQYQAVPAAWHPDPTGRHTHRYWDGAPGRRTSPTTAGSRSIRSTRARRKGRSRRAERRRNRHGALGLPRGAARRPPAAYASSAPGAICNCSAVKRARICRDRSGVNPS